jgi:hypothetical protein
MRNVPIENKTWDDFKKLACEILDPIVDRFGPIKITYGFASPNLFRHIQRGISPARDQHAGSENNSKGKPICDRAGAAVDFACQSFIMTDVAIWIIENLMFDRLYFYGPDRPLHISTSASPKQLIYSMYRSSYSGLRVPKRVNIKNPKL